MKVAVFTSNQPRHLYLARQLASLSETVHVISEVNTVFPGKISDFFKKSDVMQEYFSKVIESEKRIFGDIDFLPSNVSTLAIKSGDLNLLSEAHFGEALSADVFVVFGASYIKGWLIEFLVSKKALNVHVGLSPYYRGSSCNFWALYDGNPAYVGATIHMLSKGLDSGDILFHCIPKLRNADSPFDFTMRSVLAAHEGLIRTIEDGSILSMPAVKQDRGLEVRYSRNAEFTDDIAKEFLDRNLSLSSASFEYPELLSPVFT